MFDEDERALPPVRNSPKDVEGRREPCRGLDKVGIGILRVQGGMDRDRADVMQRFQSCTPTTLRELEPRVLVDRSLAV